MSSNELRLQLTALAQRFVDDVLAAIERAPLAEVADALPRTSGRARRPASVAPSLDAPVADRRLVRRSGVQIQQLREIILRALTAADRPVPAAQIARDASVQTADLAFPMAQLREQGLVEKEGLRTQAVYRLAKRAEDDHRGKKKKKHKGR